METNNHQTKSRFLGLPSELRNVVYHHVLSAHDHFVRIQATRPLVKEPALIRTCKQIRNDAMPIFYGTKTFLSPSSSNLVHFFQRFDRRRLSLIRNLRAPSTTDYINITIAARSRHSFALLYARPRASCKFQVLCCKEMFVLDELISLGERLLSAGVRNGLKADALFIPLVNPDPEAERRFIWHTVEESGQYTLEENGGKLKIIEQSV